MSGRSDIWSRRKAAVEAEARAAETAKAEAAIAEQHQALEAKSDEEVLAELDLPDPATLKPGDDFAAFLKQAVPERIRRVALRQLWASNPALANLDGLVEYGEDYTDAATVIENMSTTYQVGKGMKAHVDEMLRQAAAEEAETDADTDTTDATEDEACDPVEDEESQGGEIAEVANSDKNTLILSASRSENSEQNFEVSPDLSAESAMKPRRMRYHFGKKE